jgi:hypothetical protein
LSIAKSERVSGAPFGPPMAADIVSLSDTIPKKTEGPKGFNPRNVISRLKHEFGNQRVVRRRSMKTAGGVVCGVGSGCGAGSGARDPARDKVLFFG